MTLAAPLQTTVFVFMQQDAGLIPTDLSHFDRTADFCVLHEQHQVSGNCCRDPQCSSCELHFVSCCVHCPMQVEVGILSLRINQLVSLRPRALTLELRGGTREGRPKFKMLDRGPSALETL